MELPATSCQVQKPSAFQKILFRNNPEKHAPQVEPVLHGEKPPFLRVKPIETRIALHSANHPGAVVQGLLGDRPVDQRRLSVDELHVVGQKRPGIGEPAIG